MKNLTLTRSARLLSDAATLADPLARRRYALSTESFVAQDGWVLRAAGGRLRMDPLPALYNHGRGVDGELPIGRWHDATANGADFEMSLEYADANPKVPTYRALADGGFLFPSVSFEVTKWHEPTGAERAQFGIPAGEQMAGIADEWLAKEGSLVSVPADVKAGKRGLAEAIERGVVTAEALESIEPKDRDYDKIHADALALMDGAQKFVIETVGRMTTVLESLDARLRTLQAIVTERDAVSTRVGDPSLNGDGQKATQSGRKLYDLTALEMATRATKARLASLASNENPHGREARGGDS